MLNLLNELSKSSASDSFSFSHAIPALSPTISFSKGRRQTPGGASGAAAGSGPEF
jgi:hypothetical protein